MLHHSQEVIKREVYHIVRKKCFAFIYVFFYLKGETQHIPLLKKGGQGGDVIVVLPLSAVVKNSLTTELYANALSFNV